MSALTLNLTLNLTLTRNPNASILREMREEHVVKLAKEAATRNENCLSGCLSGVDLIMMHTCTSDCLTVEGLTPSPVGNPLPPLSFLPLLPLPLLLPRPLPRSLTSPVLFAACSSGHMAHYRVDGTDGPSIWVIGCEWVSLGVTGCHWVSMGVNGCQWVSMGANGCQWVSMGANGCQWVSMGVNGWQWVPMGVNMCQWVSLAGYNGR